MQALVGFEKTIKHLDDHLVDIGSKVSIRCQSVVDELLATAVPSCFR